MRRFIPILPFGLLLAGCGGTQSSNAPAASETSPRATVVDSVLPMDVMLDRFRAGLEKPAAMTNGASSRDELVSRVIDALETSDTQAFERLAVNRAVFAWLYFPTSVNAEPPYELSPALAWFRLQEANRSGVLRALREYGGRRPDFRGYRCNDEPVTEGENRVWTGCTLTIGRDGEPPVAVKFFSAILERDGQFAVLSYDNDF